MSEGDPTKRSSDNSASDLNSRQELLQIVKRGAEFTEELLKENERLRYHLAELETRRDSTTGDDDSLVKELLEKVRRLESEREQLAQKFSVVEAQNRDFADRYVEIETENSNLLNIYVASYQLHSTLDFNEVLQILTEIILNFVGADVFAIGLVPESPGPLYLLLTEGIKPEDLTGLRTDVGVVGEVVQNGRPIFKDDVTGRDIDFNSPLICIPLKIKNQLIGVIIIYRFLLQKKKLASVDHELFTLLAGHAATAIFASRLYSDSARKLKTIRGFIDLVTSPEASG